METVIQNYLRELGRQAYREFGPDRYYIGELEDQLWEHMEGLKAVFREFKEQQGAATMVAALEQYLENGLFYWYWEETPIREKVTLIGKGGSEE